MDHQLQILLSEEGADAERVDDLTRRLRAELLELDVEDVKPVSAGPPPPGARAVELAAIGSLLVGLGSSTSALHQVMSVIRDWWGRGRDTRPSLRLTLDGDVLEIGEASPEQVTRAFDVFVRRHAGVEA